MKNIDTKITNPLDVKSNLRIKNKIIFNSKKSFYKSKFCYDFIIIKLIKNSRIPKNHIIINISEIKLITNLLIHEKIFLVNYFKINSQSQILTNHEILKINFLVHYEFNWYHHQIIDLLYLMLLALVKVKYTSTKSLANFSNLINRLLVPNKVCKNLLDKVSFNKIHLSLFTASVECKYDKVIKRLFSCKLLIKYFVKKIL